MAILGSDGKSMANNVCQKPAKEGAELVIIGLLGKEWPGLWQILGGSMDVLKVCMIHTIIKEIFHVRVRWKG
jgi:hypothetical protein